MNTLFILIFRLLGWKTEGDIPRHLPKAIWVLCPHWKSMDFVIGILARSVVGIKIGYLGKASLFRWYSNWFFKGLGGYPVDRSKSNNLVEAVAETFRQHEKIHIALTPEGTRSDTAYLKTGFYYMALKAHVPLVLVGIDYPRKAIIFGNVLYLTGDYAADLKPFYEFYATIGGPKKRWLRAYLETGEIEVPKRKSTQNA
ncbi:MAG: 1-acyl-sn-glycerol-3-phosphate acyltransferase [Runella sp.]